MKTDEQMIDATVAYVKETLSTAEGGHDWWHIYRVWNNAKHILEHEPGRNRLIVELGALLHDIADAKFHDGDEDIGPRTAREFLAAQQVDPAVINDVENIVRHISFKSAIGGQAWTSPELEIVQDADRLDALGAIGIARTFNYGGHKGRALYDPNVPPDLAMSKEAYKNSTAPTLNHFYEKLFLLKDRMNTKTGKELARERHQFMQEYIERFMAEWNGEK